VGDRATAIDEHSDLSPNVARQFGQLPGEFVVEQDTGVEAASKQAIELLDLAGLEAARVAVDLDGGLPEATK